MQEGSLVGRCGSCAYFIALSKDEAGRGIGECRLGCWPAPLRATSTCAHHKALGSAWVAPQAARRTSSPRGLGRKAGRVVDARPPQPALPKEIDLDMDTETFKATLTAVLDEALGLSDHDLGDRWRGGELVLVPGRQETQDKHVPIEVFFKKLTAIREKLRVLEQKLNGHPDLSAEDKASLQGYITSCYGSLTTFNVLFRDRESAFVGNSGKD